MAYTAYITTAGQEAIAAAQYSGYKISLVRFVISNTLITETNPVVIRNYTQLPGTVVFDSGNNPAGNILTYTKNATTGITITTYLNSTLGDFTIGSIGLYLEDGTLFAILKLTETYSKTKNTSSVAGNTIAFPFSFVLTLQDVLNLSVTPESVTSLSQVATEADLPLYSIAPYANYFIQNFASTNQTAIACRTNTGWQYIVSYNHDVLENWVKALPENFATGVVEGNIVYLDTVLGKWTNLDGDGDEKKLIGIRQGNGVRTGNFFYRNNAFVPGENYFCDTYPQVGKLTLRSSRYYIGTALTNSLLKVAVSYDAQNFTPTAPTHYDAHVVSGSIIRLVLDDVNLYPDSYYHGLSVSFVSPINCVANQQIQIGSSLAVVPLTKRLTGLAGSYSSLEAGAFPAGSLLKLIYLKEAEGFVIEAEKLQASTTTRGVSYLNNPITIANNASDANNDIDFSAGNFQFSDGSGQALATAIMTKRLDATWSAGSGNGGLFNGTAVPKAVNSTYHCYKIYNPTTGAEDSGFLLGISGTAPNPTSVLPSGYTKFKRVASILTDGSGNIRAFTQFGNYFKYTSGISDVNTSFVAGSTTPTVSTPFGINSLGIFNIGLSISSISTGNNIWSVISDFNQTSSLGIVSIPQASVNVTKIPSFINIASSPAFAFTNLSSQVKIFNNEGVLATTLASISLLTHGFIDINLNS
jgi:hypothetical protein